MVRSGLLGLIRSIVGLTLVCDISDVSRVGIGNAVGHNLGAAIGKSHAVFASHDSIGILINAEISKSCFNLSAS